MLRLGIDVGGMSIKGGIVREDGIILGKRRAVLAREGDPELFCNTIIRLCFDLLKKNGIEREEIASVGVGLPTAASDLMDEIPFITNIRVENVPIRARFGEAWEIPLVLSNDAVSAAWGEYLFGAGRGCENFIAVTLGTGVGGGIVLQGKPFLGKNGIAGEVGHMVTHQGGRPCNCGRKGCWEQYASATALMAMTRAAMKKTPESAMWRLCGNDLSRVTGRTAFEGALVGDEAAREVCGNYCEELAGGLLSLINILQPERIALGGGVSQAEESLLLEPVRRLITGKSFAALGQVTETRIVTAELGNDAGIIGAAFMKPMG